MEEVDGIIIHILKTVGCDVSDSVQSLKQFTTELVVEGIALCVKALNGALDIPTRLPPSMTARFKVGTALAQAVQSLGYKGEVGYQTFLYSSEADVRKVFLFLVQQLQKQQSVTTREELPENALALLQRNIAAEIKRCLLLPWFPPHCELSWPESRSFQATPLAQLSSKDSPNLKAIANMSFITSQPRCHSNIPASVLEASTLERCEDQERERRQKSLSRGNRGQLTLLTDRGIPKSVLEAFRQSMKDEGVHPSNSIRPASIIVSPDKLKASRFKHIETLQFKKEDSVPTALNLVASVTHGNNAENEEQRRQQELSNLESEVRDYSDKTEALIAEMKKMTSAIAQMADLEETTNVKNKDKELQYSVQKKTVDLLPNAEENISKLEELVNASTKRLVRLAQQWDKHRQPLIDEIRELEESATAGLGNVEDKVAKIEEVKEKIQSCVLQTKSKEELIKQLQVELESLTKDINRTAYTRRIMEILANIQKQKDGINKIINDTKSLQKDINQLTGKLDRTFTVTDELIFQDVKKDEMSRKAYKFLAALHENCSLIISTVEETGVIFREIRDLEDQIEQANSHSAQQNLEKISADLSKIKEENADLIRRLKKASNT